jgi:hypothetical protein
MRMGEGTPPRHAGGSAPHPPTSERYPVVVTRTRNPIRRLYHAVLVVLGWALFAFTWYHIFYRHTARDAILTFLLLAVVFAGVMIVNLLWVALNVGIYRRRGSRTQVRVVPFTARSDALGRSLEHPDWEELKSAAVVTVRVEPARGVKVYEVAAPGPAVPRR